MKNKYNLKTCASIISNPLSYIYYHLLYTGIFHGHLKMEVVKLLYKKEETNYRPLSLLTVLSKVLSKSGLIRLIQHLYINIMVTEQHGFRKLMSSVNTAFRLIDNVFKSIIQNACCRNFT
jgi:hypothetical protein